MERWKRYSIAAFGIGLVLIILYWIPPIHRVVKPGLVRIGLVEQRLHSGKALKKFTDYNDRHLKYAKAYGIRPLASEQVFKERLDDLLDGGKLVKIKKGRGYRVACLTHSYPYLTPRTKNTIAQMGERFHQKVKAAGHASHRFVLSSALRTGDSQKKLGQHNINAAETSSHLYGTTIDISYKTFRRSWLGLFDVETDNPAIHKILGETLAEFRRKKKLVVVTERAQACYHITIIP